MDQDEAIRRIRRALARRSGKRWSVAREPGWRARREGWILISVPPSRRLFEWDGVTPARRANPARRYGSRDDVQELARLLGLEPDRISPAGVSVCDVEYEDYVARAEARDEEISA